MPPQFARNLRLHINFCGALQDQAIPNRRSETEFSGGLPVASHWLPPMWEAEWPTLN